MLGWPLSGATELPSPLWALPRFPLIHHLFLLHSSAPFCLLLPLLWVCQSLRLDLIVYGNSVQQTAHPSWELPMLFPNGHFDPTVSDSQRPFCPFLCSLFPPRVLPPLLPCSARPEDLSAPADGSLGLLGLPDRGWMASEEATAVENEGCAGARCSAPGHEFQKCGPQKCQLFL